MNLAIQLLRESTTSWRQVFTDLVKRRPCGQFIVWIVYHCFSWELIVCDLSLTSISSLEGCWKHQIPPTPSCGPQVRQPILRIFSIIMRRWVGGLRPLHDLTKITITVYLLFILVCSIRRGSLNTSILMRVRLDFGVLLRGGRRAQAQQHCWWMGRGELGWVRDWLGYRFSSFYVECAGIRPRDMWTWVPCKFPKLPSSQTFCIFCTCFFQRTEAARCIRRDDCWWTAKGGEFCTSRTQDQQREVLVSTNRIKYEEWKANDFGEASQQSLGVNPPRKW